MKHGIINSGSVSIKPIDQANHPRSQCTGQPGSELIDNYMGINSNEGQIILIWG